MGRSNGRYGQTLSQYLWVAHPIPTIAQESSRHQTFPAAADSYTNHEKKKKKKRSGGEVSLIEKKGGEAYREEREKERRGLGGERGERERGSVWKPASNSSERYASRPVAPPSLFGIPSNTLSSLYQEKKTNQDDG